MLSANYEQNEAQVSNSVGSTDVLNFQPTTVSQAVNEIEKCIKSLEESFNKIPWDKKECYAEFLAQGYYLTSHISRLGALVISQCSTNSVFFPLFIESFQEELGHDSLAVRDLKSLGYSIELFPELPATSSIYHSIFYFINYERTLSFLGYKIVLEGFASLDSQKLFYQKMLELHRKSSTSYLRVHDSADVSHYKQGLEMLQMCESEDLIAICKVCQQLSYAFAAMLEAIAKKHLIN